MRTNTVPSSPSAGCLKPADSGKWSPDATAARDERRRRGFHWQYAGSSADDGEIGNAAAGMAELLGFVSRRTGSGRLHEDPSWGNTGGIRELILTWIALNELARTISVATLTPAGGGESAASECGIDPLVELAASNGVDAEAFRGALEKYIAAAREGDYSEKSVHALISERRTEVERELAALGASVEKAETFLQALADAGDLVGSEVEAYAHPSVDLSNARRKALAEEWRAEWLDNRERRLADAGEVFWVSLDYQDHYDDIAYYRVYEQLGFGEFDQLFGDVEKRVGERLIEGVAAGDPFGRYASLAGYYATALAENIWLVSRSRRLRVRLHAAVAAAVSSLYFAQQQDGWWPAAIASEGGEHPPSVQATAMAVIGCRRISSDEGHIRQAEQGVAWLIGEQQPEGWWRGLRGDPDVVATALALEAIAGARRPNAEPVSDRAATWLLDQQLPQGTWTGDLPPLLATIVVLSALRLAATAGQQVPADLAGALALLRRAELLAAENSTDARQLAVVAAYTALEGVLYALLGHPSINATTVRNNGQVIGFDEAWQKYEGALVDSGRLAEGKHVGGYGTLRGLTIVRDGVVHRGARPSTEDTARIVEAAVRFASEQVPEIFGFDPSQD